MWKRLKVPDESVEPDDVLVGVVVKSLVEPEAAVVRRLVGLDLVEVDGVVVGGARVLIRVVGVMARFVRSGREVFRTLVRGCNGIGSGVLALGRGGGGGTSPVLRDSGVVTRDVSADLEADFADVFALFG